MTSCSTCAHFKIITHGWWADSFRCTHEQRYKHCRAKRDTPDFHVFGRDTKRDYDSWLRRRHMKERQLERHRLSGI